MEKKNGVNIVELNSENFDSEIQTGLVFIDAFAEWCGPCKVVAPIIETLADEYVGKVKFGGLDTDKSQDIAARYGIRSIPTFLFLKDGVEVNRMVGASSKKKYVEAIELLLKE
jgi:thioredoxin 1